MRVFLGGQELDVVIQLTQPPSENAPSPRPGDAVRRLSSKDVEAAALNMQEWGDNRSLTSLVLEIVARNLDGGT